MHEIETTVLNTIKELARQGRIPSALENSGLSEKTRFADLGLDSLATIYLLNALESNLSIRIDETVLPSISSVRDLKDHIESSRHSGHSYDSLR